MHFLNLQNFYNTFIKIHFVITIVLYSRLLVKVKILQIYLIIGKYACNKFTLNFKLTLRKVR